MDVFIYIFCVTVYNKIHIRILRVKSGGEQIFGYTFLA